MRDDPADVLKVIRLSEATISKVRQNLFWAFAYNATLIPIASLGLLNPALAGLAMGGSSVSVVTNSRIPIATIDAAVDQVERERGDQQPPVPRLRLTRGLPSPRDAAVPVI